ncbi:hypothetical protein M8J77_017279 [Diaphorina citri]|nr:hypothetical protein M8J77_017279 [Diaphorina citri]
MGNTEYIHDPDPRIRIERRSDYFISSCARVAHDRHDEDFFRTYSFWLILIYYASNPYPLPRLVPPVKKPRLMFTSPVRIKPSPSTTTSPLCLNGSISSCSSNGGSPPSSITTKLMSSTSTSTPPTISINQLKTYSNSDILICGNCRELFSDLQDLLEHKKTYCKLRFTCKCTTLLDSITSRGTGDDRGGGLLLCVQCKDTFDTAWDLLVHAQAAHMIHIYEMGPHNNNSAGTVNNNLEVGQNGSGGGAGEEGVKQNGHSRVTSSEEKEGHSEEEEREDLDMQDPPLHNIKSATEAIVHALSLDQSMLIIENHHLDNALHSNKKEIINAASF